LPFEFNLQRYTEELRAKLTQAVTALDLSNKQCQELKAKLAEANEDLKQEKKIASTAEAEAKRMLSEKAADDFVIETLKRELQMALEVQAAAETRAAEAEAALFKSGGGASAPSDGGAEVAVLRKELNEVGLCTTCM
jgi:membrane carboxypeptidase/penicillin-binding protein PbpC